MTYVKYPRALLRNQLKIRLTPPENRIKNLITPPSCRPKTQTKPTRKAPKIHSRLVRLRLPDPLLQGLDLLRPGDALGAPQAEALVVRRAAGHHFHSRRGYLTTGGCGLFIYLFFRTRDATWSRTVRTEISRAERSRASLAQPSDPTRRSGGRSVGGSL